MRIQEVTNEVKYIEWLTDYYFAVWNGGHTVNFYTFSPGNNEVNPATCINVGSFEKNSATLQEVKEGIDSIREELEN